jgi:hypothetical protein
VQTSASGVPVSFEYNGRTWRVAAEPVCWFERIDWGKRSLELRCGISFPGGNDVVSVSLAVGHKASALGERFMALTASQEPAGSDKQNCAG